MGVLNFIKKHRKSNKLFNVKLESVNTLDYPDFVDAFASYAERHNGTPLSNRELDLLNNNRDLIHELVMTQFF